MNIVLYTTVYSFNFCVDLLLCVCVCVCEAYLSYRYAFVASC